MTSTKTVLIVDDDPDDAGLLMESLLEITPTLEFLIASNGVEALLLLEKQITSLNLIILDIKMPRMNGIEFIQLLKKDKRFKDIPLVIFSSTFLFTDKDYLTSLGAIQCLKKPNTYDKLRDICAEIIEILKQP